MVLLWRQLYTNTRKLVSNKCDDEASYIPLVREYIALGKEYEGPKEAATQMTKSLKRKQTGTGEGRQKKKKGNQT